MQPLPSSANQSPVLKYATAKAPRSKVDQGAIKKRKVAKGK